MKINKLNKEPLVLKEDYAKMIVKSYKSRSEQSRAMFILSAENFYKLIKSAVFKAIYSFRKPREEIKQNQPN
jgi:hypothetical protein